MANDNSRIAALIAAEIGARAEQAAAAIQLLDEGSTVPFIARYRKEVTGGLDDTQLRQLAERLIYLRELNARRAAILDSIREQGKLTDALEAQIVAAVTKAELEDLYLPYKPKRRTRAEIARERGLGPLAEAILADRALVPAELAKAYVVGEVTDVKMALEGARDIVTDTIAVNSELVGKLRAYMQARAVLRARVVDGKQEAGAKFSDYFDHAERWADAPSHRALAMLRGRNEGVLSLEIEVDADSEAPVKPVEAMIAEAYQVASAAPGDLWLRDVVRWTWRVRLSTSLSLDLMMELHDRAEQEAIKVFARNLKDLLLAAPAGSRPTLGLDPGIRTGVKVAVVDDTAAGRPAAEVEGSVRGQLAADKGDLLAVAEGEGRRAPPVVPVARRGLARVALQQHEVARHVLRGARRAFRQDVEDHGDRTIHSDVQPFSPRFRARTPALGNGK